MKKLSFKELKCTIGGYTFEIGEAYQEILRRAKALF